MSELLDSDIEDLRELVRWKENLCIDSDGQIFEHHTAFRGYCDRCG